jgi:hypothetical protein
MNDCGGCTACCQVVPVKDLGLKQYTGCPHTRAAFHAAGPGCGIYDKRPHSCRAWSCLWLRSDWAPEMRPDRAGFVVDEIVDMIEVNGRRMPAAQIWVLKGHDDAWQRPEVNDVILTLLLKEKLAVLWHLYPGTYSIVFCRDPKTGTLSRSAPTPVAPNAEQVLGPTVQRMMRAGVMYERNRRNQGSTRFKGPPGA